MVRWRARTRVRSDVRFRGRAQKKGGVRGTRRSFADAKLAKNSIAHRFFVSTTEKFIGGVLRFLQIDREHLRRRSSADRGQSACDCIRGPAQLIPMACIDSQR